MNHMRQTLNWFVFTFIFISYIYCFSYLFLIFITQNLQFSIFSEVRLFHSTRFHLFPREKKLIISVLLSGTTFLYSAIWSYAIHYPPLWTSFCHLALLRTLLCLLVKLRTFLHLLLRPRTSIHLVTLVRMSLRPSSPQKTALQLIWFNSVIQFYVAASHKHIKSCYFKVSINVYIPNV